MRYLRLRHSTPAPTQTTPSSNSSQSEQIAEEIKKAAPAEIRSRPSRFGRKHMIKHRLPQKPMQEAA